MHNPRLGRRRASRRSGDLSKIPPALASEPVPLEDVLVTYKLGSRRRRKPNSYQENLAFRALAKAMADSPDKLIDTLLQAARELCCAGTAGLSIVETLPSGEQVFRWTHLAGDLSNLVGETNPRHFSLCGTALDLNAPQLFDRPARRFEFLKNIGSEIVEALVMPIHLGEQKPGTIWIYSHDDECKFDAEDARLMTGLAEFAAGALRLMHASEHERQAREEGAKQIAAHQRTEESLRRAQTNLEQIVRARTTQLQQLTSRLMALQDEERRRIARELHDSAGQYLAGMTMNLRALMHDSATLGEAHTARVADSLAMAELCTAEIRTISYLLHPPLLDEVGLASAISWYVDGFSQRSGIQVRLEIQDDIGRLPQDLENALFRIVQQSLANIHRHSGSQVAEIKILLDAENLLAEICDQGCGIAQEMLDGFHDGTRLVGVGMAGMRERIRDMGGHFEIRSSDKGTTIAVRLPLPAVPEVAQIATV
jgi:two-component system NarL family sensor kinase